MKNNTHFDVHFQFVQDIAQPFIDLIVVHNSGNGKYDMVYTNKTIDVCKFLINRKSNIFFDMTYKIMSDYVDMPKRCPIRKVPKPKILFFFSSISSFYTSQKQYQLLNAFMDPEKFPSFLPDHKARVSVFGWCKDTNRAKKNLAKYNFDLVIERSFKINGSEYFAVFIFSLNSISLNWTTSDRPVTYIADFVW